MDLRIKCIVTNVVSTDKRDYVSLVDLENGGVFSVGVDKGSAVDLPRLVPIELVARARGSRYGLFFEVYSSKKGGE